MSVLENVISARDVVFVGGKGGVGKTAVASALGLRAARAGRAVLVVSTDPAHNLGHLWQRPVGDTAVHLAPGLRGLEIDPKRTTDAHLSAVRSTLQRLMPEHLQGEVTKHLELARDAPGTHEAAVLERVAQVVESRASGELIIFDTAPSGHTTRLVALPELMQAWTEGLLRRQDRSAKFSAALRGLERDDDGAAAGIIGSSDGGPSRAGRGPGGLWRSGGDRRTRRDAQIREILQSRQARFRMLREVLQDPRQTAFIAVLAAERLPVLETIELEQQLGRSGMAVAALVINKRSPQDAGQLLAARRRQEEVHLGTLHQALPHLPRVEVPLLGEDILGEEGLSALGACLY